MENNIIKIGHIKIIFIISIFGIVFQSFRTKEIIQDSDQKKIKIIFTGDISWGESYQLKLEKKGKENILFTKGYDYCIEKLKLILQQSNLIIGNLETPLTDLKRSPLENKDKYKLHKGDLELTPATLKKNNIACLSLANNHSMDYGVEGLDQTILTLKKYGLSYFGSGKNAAAASEPFIYDWIESEQKFKIIVMAGMPVDEKYKKEYQFYASDTSAGVNGWTEKSAFNQVRVMRKQNKDAFIVVYPHWLENYKWITKKQTALSHIFIEAGADAVIGHGTHMFQEIELHKGKWIVYSLGNFLFNSPGRYSKKKIAHSYSMVALLELKKAKEKYGYILKLYPIQSDNIVTKYQPRPVNSIEMDTIQNGLVKLIGTKNKQSNNFIQKDSSGFFIKLSSFQ